MTHRPLLASLLLVPACAPSAPAGETSGLVCTPLESPTPVGSSFPSLVCGPRKQILTWVQTMKDGHAVNWASLGSSSPASWSAPETIVASDQLFVNWADFPGLVVLPGQQEILFAHWLEKRAGGGYDAKVAWRNATGWTEPRRLHDDDSDVEHGFVSALLLGASEVGALWLDGRQPGSTALLFRSLSVDGEAGPEQVLDPRVCSCCPTSLVSTRTGDGWRAAYRDRSPEEIRDIAWLSSDDPTPRIVHDDGWMIAGCPVNGPRLAPLHVDGAVAWFTAAEDGPGQVYVAFGEEDGSFGPPIDVDDGNPAGRVDLLALGSGGVLVTWMEYADGEKDAAWRARLVDAGAAKGDALRPSLTITEIDSSRTSGHLRLAPGREGVVAAWTTSEPRIALAVLQILTEED